MKHQEAERVAPSEKGRYSSRMGNRWGALLTMGAGLMGSILAVACTSDGPPPIGETASAIISPTACNQGASDPVVVPEWGTVTTGTRSATDFLATQLKNRYGFNVNVSLEMKSRGLDGRIVTRTAWSGSVAAGQTRTINIRPADFPVQSVGSATVVTLDAVITASGQPHLVGARIPSKPLVSRFSSDYASVTLAGENDAEASAVEPYASAETFINQVSAVGRSLSTYVGRVWNGTTMVNVGTLPVVSDDATRYATLRTHVFSDTDSLQWDKFFDNVPPSITPGDQDPNGNRVCARVSVDFIDENRGEPVYGATFAGNGYPAAYTLLSIFAADDNKLLWSGYANSEGCTPRLQGLSSGRFVMSVESRLRAYSLNPVRDANVDVRLRKTVVSTDLPARQAVGFRVFAVSPTPPATDIRIRLDATDRRVMAAAAMAQTLRTPTVPVPSGNYPVRLSRCGGDDTSTTNATACADSTIWLGLNRDPGRTHNAQWKFVINHEFGHGIQQKSNVEPALQYDGVSLQPICTCNHVSDTADQAHCMQSKEMPGAAGAESFADLVATSTWSGTNPGACTFVYYKETNTAPPAAPLTPPNAVDCAAQVQWVKTQCGDPGRGSEWDWNNWYRSLTVSPVSPVNQRTTIADLVNIQRAACGGTSCGGLQPLPSQFITSANSYYGINTPRAARFSDRAAAYGVTFTL